MSAAEFVAIYGHGKTQSRDRLSVAGSRGVINPMARGGWKPAWRVVGGQRFYARSKAEANYGRYLEWLRERQDIMAWEHESETFWFDRIKRGVRSYLPDFEVVKLSGLIEYHEVKGWMDKKSATKLKRMKRYYPSVSVVLIDQQKITQITRQVGALIPGWE